MISIILTQIQTFSTWKKFYNFFSVSPIPWIAVLAMIILIVIRSVRKKKTKKQIVEGKSSLDYQLDQLMMKAYKIPSSKN